MEFTGEFETHLTVSLEGAAALDALRRSAEGRGLKCLHIVLEQGQSRSQPMLTRRGRGILSSELAAAEAIRADLAADGFNVTRIKIEAAPGNDDVPQTDEDATKQSGPRYFEHHVKLRLVPEAELAALVRLALRHSAHVSQNALRNDPDGSHERFVTQRCWHVGKITAGRHLQALLDDLAGGPWCQLDVEEEFVVYDSNLEVDAGWLQAGA